MFKTENIEKLVRYAIISGFIKRDISPISLMLIAKPEHNKTSILKTFENMKNVYYTTDLSPKPLIEFLKRVDAGENYHHIIVPDFIKVVVHNKITAHSTVTTLNAMIEEGIQNSNYYGQEIHLKNNIRCGLITSITPELYKQQFKVWNDMGFLTRFLPVAYEYSDETRFKIMQMIQGNGGGDLDSDIGKIKKAGQKNITIDNDVAAGIALFVDDLVTRLNNFEVTMYYGDVRQKVRMNIQGFRLHKQLRLLAKAIAFDRKLDHVNYECIAELRELISYLSTPNTPKIV